MKGGREGGSLSLWGYDKINANRAGALLGWVEKENSRTEGGKGRCVGKLVS